MLTKQDLKAIENILDTKLEEKLESKFEEKLKPVYRKLDKLDKKIDLISKTLDRDIVSHGTRIRRLEDHCGLPPLSTSTVM